MAELIKKQDAIDAVLKAHCYGTGILEALKKLPTTTEAEIMAKVIDELLEKMELWEKNIENVRGECAFFTIANIRAIAEQLKGKMKDDGTGSN